MTAVAPVELARLGAGSVGLLAPQAQGRFEAPAAAPFSTGVYRVLGGRQLAQGALLLRAAPVPHRLGAAVDGLHAASMLALAALSARYRRAALTQSVIAAGFCLAEVVMAARSSR